jgi:nitrite reductase (cytochrome c-552)
MSRKGALAGVIVGLICVGIVFVAIRVVAVRPAPAVKVGQMPSGEYDPAVWGKTYPLEYRSYQKNFEMSESPTGFGGSLKVQHFLKQPEILINFKGMAFSKDYSEDRGHPYALKDLMDTKRITPKTLGACMTCKTANLIDIYKDKGWTYAKTPLPDLLPFMKHPIVCANCHDPSTMNLRAINPAFIEAMGRRGIDIAKASREEMRSYVCGQCHGEYYFEPETSRVILPWDKGFHPEHMYAYYAGKPQGFSQDWVHPDSEAKMLKAQHPDFETWHNGVHGKSGVACADCHMPFMRDKGWKYSSHWVTSPMRHIEASCHPCHTQSSDWLLDRVKTVQNNVWQLQHTAGLTLSRAHEAIGKAAIRKNADKNELDKARELVRKAQWYWDFIAAANSMGFHNPDQTLNVLGQSIDMSNQAITAANQAIGPVF